MSFFKSIAIFFLLFYFINNSYCQSNDSNLNSFLPVEILHKHHMYGMNYDKIFRYDNLIKSDIPFKTRNIKLKSFPKIIIDSTFKVKEKNGKVIKEGLFNVNEWEIDSLGRIISWKRKNYFSSDEIKSGDFCKYTYDQTIENNILTYKKIRNKFNWSNNSWKPGNEREEFIEVNNNSNKIIKFYRKINEGQTYTREYFHDRIITTSYSDDNKIKWFHNYKNNNLLSSETHLSKISTGRDFSSSYCNYKYNNDLIVEFKRKSGNTGVKFIISYNSDENISSIQRFDLDVNGDFNSTNITYYIYDIEKKLYKWEHFSFDGNIKSNKKSNFIEFDEKGNPIYFLYTKGQVDFPQYETVRNIEYYEKN